jgi:hypothetical protein
MRTSKQILHAQSFSASAPHGVLNWRDILRTTTLVAAFVFLGACVLGAI